MSSIMNFAPLLDYYIVFLPKALKLVYAIFEVGFKEEGNGWIYFVLEDFLVKFICYQKVKCFDMKIQSWEIMAGPCMLIIQQIW